MTDDSNRGMGTWPPPPSDEPKTLRDDFALSIPDDRVQFATLEDMAAYVGSPVPSTYAEQVGLSLVAIAKLRYAYADAMMEARKQ